MVLAGHRVFPHRVKVFVRHALLQAKLFDDRGHFGVVAVMHPGEQMMLDLVVEAAVEEAQPLAA